MGISRSLRLLEWINLCRSFQLIFLLPSDRTHINKNINRKLFLPVHFCVHYFYLYSSNFHVSSVIRSV